MKKLRVIALAIALIMTFGIFSACSGAAKKDNYLYVAYVGSTFPGTFMPWLSNTGIAPNIVGLMYRTLFSYESYDYDLVEGKTFAGETYYENIGKSWRYVDAANNYATIPEQNLSLHSDDPYLVVEIKLNDDIKWTDGTQLTAEDVFYTFDLCADFSRTNHTGASAWIASLNHKYTSGVLSVQGVYTKGHAVPPNGVSGADYSEKLTDDYTVYLHVQNSTGAITSLFQTITILPRHIWGDMISVSSKLFDATGGMATSLINEGKRAVGNGPYKLDSNGAKDLGFSDGQIRLIKNTYYQNDTYSYFPEGIVFNRYADANQAVQALKKGVVDMIMDNPNVTAGNLNAVKDDKDIVIDSVEDEFITTLVLNISGQPASASSPARQYLADKRVRKAIALALDQTELIDNFLSGAGTAGNAGLFKSGTEYVNASTGPIGGGRTQAERVAEANALLDDFGATAKDGAGIRLKDTIKLSYKILTTEVNHNLVNYIKEQLGRIGIEVAYDPAGSDVVKDNYYTGKFDMCFQGVTLTWSNLDLMLKSHFVNTNGSNYGQLNAAEYEIDGQTHQKLDAFFDEVIAETNRAAKIEKIKRLQEVLAEMYYKLPVYVSHKVAAHRTDRYTGWLTYPGYAVWSDYTLMNLKKK